MTVSWTRHRFSGGALALDVANTVVLRGDDERSFDRFADVAEIARFADAAAGFRSKELQGRRVAVADAKAIAVTVIDIRETTDRLFRHAVVRGQVRGDLLAAFLNACAVGVAGAKHLCANVSDGEPMAFEAALAVSALALLSGDKLARLRICPNCRWLFLDGSRNGSRLWCDMAVCGNRQKARRHYHRHKNGEEVSHG